MDLDNTLKLLNKLDLENEEANTNTNNNSLTKDLFLNIPSFADITDDSTNYNTFAGRSRVSFKVHTPKKSSGVLKMNR
jgi:hypothetical protein